MELSQRFRRRLARAVVADPLEIGVYIHEHTLAVLSSSDSR